jgi:hypothetical protein
MSQATGFHDARGIPIHVGDLIRMKHFRHPRRRQQMWLYYRVALIDGVAVIQHWHNLDPQRHATVLKLLYPEDVEVLDHHGLERNERGELITFNERPRLKRKAGE